MQITVHGLDVWTSCSESYTCYVQGACHLLTHRCAHDRTGVLYTNSTLPLLKNTMVRLYTVVQHAVLPCGLLCYES